MAVSPPKIGIKQLLIAPHDSDILHARESECSAKTADHHIQHIYNKVVVSTRAASAIWTMQLNNCALVDGAMYFRSRVVQ
jgi:DNA-binding CsgD family transcriptional regulator